MSCCGQKRQHLRAGEPSQPAAGPLRPPGQAPLPPILVHFEYVGATALTVVGPVTRTRYRFSAPGAVLAIDARDALAVATVPHLRQTRRP
ncbi:MAG: hypothetical protein AB2L07_00240 [Thermoanaerobaculaceae bacterium]